MIPYAILMVELKLNNGSAIKIRALDQIQNGFTFKVPDRYDSSLILDSNEAECTFLDFGKKEYLSLSLSDFNITYDNNLYCFTSENADFIANYNGVISDYINYIRLKQSNDETEIMANLTDLKLSENYTNSIDEFKRAYTVNPITWNTPLNAVEIAIALDNDYLIDEFLKMPYLPFISLYWAYNSLQNHPISKQQVTHVYIGNQFCPLLFPSSENLEQILDKCIENNVTPVITFSTMPEHLIETVSKQLMLLEKYAINNSLILEIVINDIGIASLARELNCFNLTFTLGVLLNKQKKDPRLKYKTASQKEMKENYQSSLDSSFYQQYLMDSFGISKISKEVCGYNFDISTDTVLHLPLFQTNTSGHCIMHALCTTGYRGFQKQNDSCPHFCSDEFIAYPDNTDLIGLYNSIFGVSMAEINDVCYLNSQICKGVSRLVIRL